MRRAALLLLGLFLFAGAAVRDLADDWIDRTRLPDALVLSSVEVRDRSGRLLRPYQVGTGLWRLRTTPADVDPDYLAMLLHYEDRRFYSHAGVDILAMVRAAGQAVWHGRAVSGGSTLTMQVARLLEDGRTGTWAGKARQIRVALALERKLSKDAILALYLTNAPFGGNLEGVRSASLAWFAKEPRRLNPTEAALLVALPQAPEARRPDRHPDQARAARARVLERMMQVGLLTSDEIDAMTGADLPTDMSRFPTLAAHLSDWARNRRPLSTTVTLTLDATVQDAMETLVSRAARRAGPRVSAALVVADHTTGELIASVGSAAYDAAANRQGFVDMSRAIRSPGSTLKPLIYGLAFDQGLAHPETLIQDTPVTFGRYAPQNFDGGFRGDVRVRDALQVSLNVPVVRLTQALGPARIMDALERAEAPGRLPGGTAGLAVALGGLGLSLVDLVQLYTVLAQGGRGPILSALPDSPDQMSRRVLSPSAAWQVSNILAGITPPNGGRAGQIAYKTGTSYGHRDAWAIGYDGRHVIGVWLGRPDGTPVPGAFGGDTAAPVLFEAFGRLKPQPDALPPPPPETLIVATADLPAPLRRFRARGSSGHTATNAPDLTFPPDGARIRAHADGLTLKLRGGVAPFAVLADGDPIKTGQRGREFDIPTHGPGFTTLVILDSAGQSDQITIELE